MASVVGITFLISFLTMILSLLTISLALVPLAVASAVRRDLPRPAAVIEQEIPLITPSPATWNPTKTYKSRRGIFSDIKQDVGGVLSDLGNIPSYVASGIPNFFQDFPTGDKVKSSLGIDDDQIAALPTQVLNVP